MKRRQETHVGALESFAIGAIRIVQVGRREIGILRSDDATVHEQVVAEVDIRLEGEGWRHHAPKRAG